jgi:hypothetical protein
VAPHRRLLAWIYTGPLGHLWSTSIDVVVLWARLGGAKLRGRYSSNR